MQRVNITGKDRRAMAGLVRADGVQLVRQTLRELGDGRYRVQGFGEVSALDELTRTGFTVEHVEDVKTTPPAPTRGRPGGGYLSVTEVDRRIDDLVAKYVGAIRLIELPHRTWENRRCRAIRIGSSDAKAPAIVLLGGVHAREWGSPDILVAFAERLLSAWQCDKGIAIGNRRFRASSVQRLIDETAVYIVPQVNPDGRHHSLTVDPLWRKNRRPAPSERDGDESCIGVDINRNFDFMWDYAKAFSSDAAVSCSTHPCDKEVFVGPAATSEPETRNVVWLLDEHPEISYLVDVHSYGELIMYSWGDDENQTIDASMNFINDEWDGKRGVFEDEYREFLPDGDRELLVRLGEAMASGIEAARGHSYRVQQSANLYPTAGTSDDYAYSRHLVDPALNKVLAFTVEWGSEDNPTPFHPPYAEMKKIIAEMTSGLLAFCEEAVRINASRMLQKVG
jgi:murein tripeptide amidase MpaA